MINVTDHTETLSKEELIRAAKSAMAIYLIENFNENVSDVTTLEIIDYPDGFDASDEMIFVVIDRYERMPVRQTVKKRADRSLKYVENSPWQLVQYGIPVKEINSILRRFSAAQWVEFLSVDENVQKNVNGDFVLPEMVTAKGRDVVRKYYVKSAHNNLSNCSYGSYGGICERCAIIKLNDPKVRTVELSIYDVSHSLNLRSTKKEISVARFPGNELTEQWQSESRDPIAAARERIAAKVTGSRSKAFLPPELGEHLARGPEATVVDLRRGRVERDARSPVQWSQPRYTPPTARAETQGTNYGPKRRRQRKRT